MGGAGKQSASFPQSARQPLSAGAIFKAPSMMIWGHRKAGIQMEPRSRKDAWIHMREALHESKMKRKILSSQATDPHYHATALQQLMGIAPKRAANLSQ